MPADSRIKTDPLTRDREEWTPEMELLASLIEVTSVGASGMRLKKPIQVPRPGAPKQPGNGLAHPDDSRTAGVARDTGRAPQPARADADASAMSRLMATARPKALAASPGGG